MADLVPYSDIRAMGADIAKSGLFGMRTSEQAIALMLIAQAEGRHPASAAMDYHVIDGRPALKADAMLARFLAAGGKVEWLQYTDECVEATFSHPAGGSVTVDWTTARAKTAGLSGGPAWKKYPRQMLRARVVSEGVRTVYPAVSVGIYTPEEVQDFDASPPRDVTPSKPAVAKPAVAKLPPHDPDTGEVSSEYTEDQEFINGAGQPTKPGDPDHVWPQIAIDFFAQCTTERSVAELVALMRKHGPELAKLQQADRAYIANKYLQVKSAAQAKEQASDDH